MSKFNTLHKSHTWAFIDGLLVGLQIGIVLTYGYLETRRSAPILTLMEQDQDQDETATS